MNTLYYGDNLDIMREFIGDETVDLIYLDPPFNSNRAYSQIFRDEKGNYPPSQIKAFDDTWRWGEESEIILDELRSPKYPPQLIQTLEGFKKILDNSDLMAYLTMMTIRLFEMKRVMKDTASIYLHCDPTASHYLKVVMDQVFGVKNFRSEIIWSLETVSGYKSQANKWIRCHDTILYYLKTDKFTFNKEYLPHKEEYIARFKKKDKDGRLYRDDRPGKRKQYLDETPGRMLGDVWNDIMSFQQASTLEERLGYPTQKPEALLERIIKASSNEGDLVLDPFCGCGTAMAAAEKLNRRWIGIDITVKAIVEIEKRLKKNFPDIKYELKGCPRDVESAKKMVETHSGRFEFESWFIRVLGGQPYKSTGGGDSGIDGFMYFKDVEGKWHNVIVSVKGGAYTPSDVRDLCRVVKREEASMGLLLAINSPSQGMATEAATAGRFQMPKVNRSYPKVQIFTVQDYFDGKLPDIPDISLTEDKSSNNGKYNKNKPELEL